MGTLVVIAAVLGHARSALADTTTGVVEVCKNPSQDVAGKMFSFTVTPAGGQSQSVSVTANATNIECSGPMTVPAGQVTVAEGTSVGFATSAVSVSGGGSLVSSDTGKQSAVVNVTAGDASAQTDVFFTNVLANGQLKVCKQAADGSDDLTPFNPFNFGVTGTGYTGPATVSANVGGCTLVTVPANLQLSISEALTSAQTSADITLANITLGTGTNGTVNVTGNNASVMIGAGLTSEVTFWNTKPKPAPTGFIEVCKAGGADVAGKTFSFTVSDTVTPSDANQTVTAGASGTTNCTLPIQVTAGNVTVAEATSVGFVVQSITAVPASALVSKDLASGTATVTVAAGDQSTQTIVTFTNQAQTGTVKVCKAAAAGSNLTGWFTFNISGTGYTGPASVQTSVGNCALISGVPVNAQLTVTESLTSAQTAAGISLAGISLASGTVGTTTATSATITVTGNAVSEVTFTNTQPQPGPQTGTLSICKIAGSGVNVGDSFSFTTSTNGGSASSPISVMAGTTAAPGCASAGTFTVGDSVVVKEAASTGVSVSAITGTSTIDLGAGTATVTIVAGDNNKVTYTNTKATTTPPTTSGCTFTKGYYKNHTDVLSAAVVAQVNAAMGTSLTADQMVTILASPVAGNFGIQLAAQLITAELNIAGGASVTAGVTAAISTAISELAFDSSGSVALAAGVTQDQASAVESVLDQYNNGLASGGPSHCGESEQSPNTTSSTPTPQAPASTPQTSTSTTATQNVSATTTQQAAPVTTATPASKPTATKPAKKTTKHVVKKKVVKTKAVKKHVVKKAKKKTHGAVKAARKTLPFTK